MAKFLPGQSGNPAGKPKGAITKRTAEFKRTLEEAGFDIPATYLKLFAQAQQGIEYGDRDERLYYLKIATDLLDKMSSYVYPKLKAIEHKRESPIESMTPEQRLEAMRQAVSLLEAQIKKD